MIQRPAHLKVRKSSKKPSPSPTRRSSQPPTSAPNQSSPVRMRKGSNPPTPTTAGGARPPQFDGPPSPTRYINYRLVNKLSFFCKQWHSGPENFKKSRPTKTREIKQSSSTKFYFDQNPFFAISKMAKNQFFELGKRL